MANWFVDNTNTPPGTGTSGNPYSSIQNAFSNAALAAGDHIKIRTGTGTYDATSSQTTKSGTVGNPIVLEPDTAATPNIRYTGNGAQTGAIYLADVDYWTVQNLTFDATGIYSSRFGIWIQAANRNVTGNKILGCTFKGWGGSEANNVTTPGAVTITGFGSASPWSPTSTTVQNCVFDANRRASIVLNHDLNSLIDNNEIKNFTGGRGADGAVNCLGIYLLQTSTGTTISNNLIHDCQPHSANTMPNQLFATWAGIWGDGRVLGTIITDNAVYNIDPTQTTTTNPFGIDVGVMGIFPESLCSNWIIARNRIYRIGQNGFRNGSAGTGDPDNTQYIGNVVYHCGQIGLDARRGHNLTIKNNIFFDNTIVNINIQTTTVGQGPHVINYNDYWDSLGGNRVGQWGASGVLNFANWKTTSSQDANSKNGDPAFVSVTAASEDFHLQNGSPCIDTGQGGVDMGVYPDAGTSPPVILAPTITQATYNSFTVTWPTDLPANSQVDYGLTSAYGSSTSVDPALVTSHSATIIGLTAMTLYHYRVKSTTSGGQLQVSADKIVITILPPPTSVIAT